MKSRAKKRDPGCCSPKFPFFSVCHQSVGLLTAKRGCSKFPEDKILKDRDKRGNNAMIAIPSKCFDVPRNMYTSIEPPDHM